MSTVAVGLDLVEVAAFARQLEDRASGFAAATFTTAELRVAAGSEPTVAAQRLAVRFAAKEALIKAWSSARRGRLPRLPTVDLREIEVVDDGFGRPALVLHGAVAAALDELAVEYGAAALDLHLSLSHEPPLAAAVVVLGVVHHGHGERSER